MKPYLPPKRARRAGVESPPGDAETPVQAREQPDIPLLKKKEDDEERKKGAVCPVGPAGGGGGAGAWAGTQALLSGEGFFPALASLLTTNARLALLTAAFTAPAGFLVHTLWTVFSARARADSTRQVVAPKIPLPVKEAKDSGDSSLALLAKANGGTEGGKGGREDFRDSLAAAPVQASAGPSAASAPAKPGESPPLPEPPAPKAAAPGFRPAQRLASMASLNGSSGISGGIMQPFLGKFDSGLVRGLMTTLRGNHAQRGSSLGPTKRPDVKKVVVPKNALGQLRFANQKSQQALRARGPEATSRVANDAFELGQTQPGGGLTLRGPGQAARPDDAESHTFAENFPPVPTVTPPANDTPYQAQLESAKSMLDAAVVAKATGIMLIITGIILFILGMILPPPIGGILKLIGLATIALGWSFILLGRRLRKSADNIATEISQKYGQKDQGTILHECVKQAKALIPAEACNPADKPVVQRGDVQEDDDVFQRIGQIPGGSDAFSQATSVTPPSDSSSAAPSGGAPGGSGSDPAPAGPDPGAGSSN